MKWDVADDVVAYSSVAAKPNVKQKRGKVAMIAAATALTTAVTVGGTAFASMPTAVHVISYGSSTSVPILERLAFVRPRGFRQSHNDELVDVQVGMSTRRLGELHRALFSVDTEPEEEIVGDYASL